MSNQNLPKRNVKKITTQRPKSLSSDQDAHALLKMLINEQAENNDLNTLVTELQGNYNQLLVKYAEAENFIDCLRFRNNETLDCNITIPVKNFQDQRPEHSELNASSTCSSESELEIQHQKSTFSKYFAHGQLNENDFVISDNLPHLEKGLEEFNFNNSSANPDFRTDSGFNGSENSFVPVDALSDAMKTSHFFKNSEAKNNNDDNSSFESVAITTRLNPQYNATSQTSLSNTLPSSTAKENYLKDCFNQQTKINNPKEESNHSAPLSKEEPLPLQDVSGNFKATSTPKGKNLYRSRTGEKGVFRSTEQESPLIHIYCYADPKNAEAKKSRTRTRKKRSSSVHASSSRSSLTQVDVNDLDRSLDEMSHEANKMKLKAAKVWRTLQRLNKNSES